MTSPKPLASSRQISLAALASIAIATILRLWSITDPATLNLQIIRQMIGAMQSRNLALGDGSWFRPLIDVAWYPNDPPVFAALEFPIAPWMTAALYSVFGVQTWIGNALSVAFSLAAAWLFFLIARRLLRSDVAALAALVPFLFLPEAYKYSRLIQPDPLSLALLMLVVYAALRATDAEATSRRWLLVGFVSLAFLLLNKVNWAVFALVPAAVLAADAGWRQALRLKVLAAAALSAVPAAAWHVWSSRASDLDTFGEVATQEMLARLLTNWSDPAFWSAVADGLNAWFFLPGLALVFAGALLAARARSREDRVLLVWVAATFLYLYVVGPTLLAPHRYYFLPLLPIGCLLIGRVAVALEGFKLGRRLARPKTAAVLAVGLSLVLAVGSWWMLRGYYAETSEEMAHFARAGEVVAANTDTDDLVVFETEDWGVTLWVSYVAERRGWTMVPPEALPDVVERGAEYVFASSGAYAEKYSTFNGDAEWLLKRPAEIVSAGGREVASVPEGTLLRLK